MNPQAVHQKINPKILNSRMLVDEGIRRYGLPFGLIGKQKTFHSDLAARNFACDPIMIIQDVRIGCPAEYIFGINLGDCLIVGTQLGRHDDSLVPSIELLLDQGAISHILVASPLVEDARMIIEDTFSFILEQNSILSSLYESGELALDGWLVDEKRRRCQKIISFP